MRIRIGGKTREQWIREWTRELSSAKRSPEDCKKLIELTLKVAWSSGRLELAEEQVSKQAVKLERFIVSKIKGIIT